MTRTAGTTTTPESYFLANLEAGAVFYTDKQDKHITASASYYSRKIKTERIIAVSMSPSHAPEASYITKVTILK
jgi:hypothetical protein